MTPRRRARQALAVTRAKAKMYEYGVPEQHHLAPRYKLSSLLDLTIGLLGDITADGSEGPTNGRRKHLLFASTYFDSLLNARGLDPLADYLRLLGGAAYYLCGYPGSAQVLVRDIGTASLKANHIDRLILSVIRKTPEAPGRANDNPYARDARVYAKALGSFIRTGRGYQNMERAAQRVRDRAYAEGSDRELLLSDVLRAMTRAFGHSSVWHSLPRLSGMRVQSWRSYIMSHPDITELWPAQMLLGEHGVFSGNSAVVQMPTSAGKTKAAAIAIRSAIASGRARVLVVVAPFRALCQEIHEGLREQLIDMEDVDMSLVSDVLQMDLGNENGEGPRVLVLTPEKLDYILRHEPEMAEKIGLAVFDEAHLFDDPNRGPRYELLLASLRRNMPASAQKLVISAVMPNAQEIGDWLIGPSCASVEARLLAPTRRSVAMSSWADARGRLQFVDESDPDRDEFFVPRLWEAQELTLRGRERKRRYYPTRGEPQHIAMFLGCQLVRNGAVAVFVGRKDSAIKMLSELLDALDRSLNLTTPASKFQGPEASRLAAHVKATLGVDTIHAKAAALGLFVHHGNTPHGLRLAIEHSLREGHVGFVVCTSTLAQGVNLPIRYLVVTTIRQASVEIKTRDFHNLMGRAGRAGRHTEGTTIFADTSLYDDKNSRRGRWKWGRVRSLLNAEESEECRSHLLTVLEPVPDEEDEQEYSRNVELVRREIESFLLKEMEDVSTPEVVDAFATELAENTLAYHQANEEQREQLVEYFVSCARDIISREPSTERRRVFARSVLPLAVSHDELNWLSSLQGQLQDDIGEDDLLHLLWPALYRHIERLPQSLPEDILLRSCCGWVAGEGFPAILQLLQEHRWGRRRVTIDHVVDLCENRFGYQGSVIIGSFIALLKLVSFESEELSRTFALLQKRLKYGLPDRRSVILYELGFTDRALAIELATILTAKARRPSRRSLIAALRNRESRVARLLSERYPAYFESVFAGLGLGQERQ